LWSWFETSGASTEAPIFFISSTDSGAWMKIASAPAFVYASARRIAPSYAGGCPQQRLFDEGTV
jgi:hypothetical protein